MLFKGNHFVKDLHVEGRNFNKLMALKAKTLRSFSI